MLSAQLCSLIMQQNSFWSIYSWEVLNACFCWSSTEWRGFANHRWRGIRLMLLPVAMLTLWSLTTARGCCSITSADKLYKRVAACDRTADDVCLCGPPAICQYSTTKRSTGIRISEISGLLSVRYSVNRSARNIRRWLHKSQKMRLPTTRCTKAYRRSMTIANARVG